MLKNSPRNGKPPSNLPKKLAPPGTNLPEGISTPPPSRSAELPPAAPPGPATSVSSRSTPNDSRSPLANVPGRNERSSCFHCPATPGGSAGSENVPVHVERSQTFRTTHDERLPGCRQRRCPLVEHDATRRVRRIGARPVDRQVRERATAEVRDGEHVGIELADRVRIGGRVDREEVASRKRRSPTRSTDRGRARRHCPAGSLASSWV